MVQSLQGLTHLRYGRWLGGPVRDYITGIFTYAANFVLLYGYIEVCGLIFLLQYGLRGHYAAPLQYGFHLFFEYAAETVGMSWHVYSTDDNCYAWR